MQCFLLTNYMFAFCRAGMRVFMHGAAATPVRLVNALAEYGKKANLKDVEVIHIHTEGPGTYAKPEYEGKQIPFLFLFFSFSSPTPCFV